VIYLIKASTGNARPISPIVNSSQHRLPQAAMGMKLRRQSFRGDTFLPGTYSYKISDRHTVTRGKVIKY
jgi:hypothetical protein